MKRLWLTYAWKDNEENDIDYIATKLKENKIDVHVDKTKLFGGKRLWEQIDNFISDETKTDAWAIYVTESSLRSEACREELYYALDRALSKRGSGFPIIGIFPTDLDRDLIPSAITSRLYITLDNENWAERVADAVEGRNTNTINKQHNFKCTIKKQKNKIWVQVRPRIGVWQPAFLGVPENSKSKIEMICPGTPDRGPDPNATMISDRTVSTCNGDFHGTSIGDRIDSNRSLYVLLDSAPSSIVFGGLGNPIKMFQITQEEYEYFTVYE
ncbi:toll/interleukin-1 receptor domain-containing protein [Breoghania sp. L-A4]|uniref:toll/interleukin-1 receptor domain-containing protein n=1 Tax=Breoghania sp. L-A4 TaxID=2304600 RepID=UPI0013C35D7F|nr:toll/interleukin-1 receptor domain-containing protein [Breoghania sp. L-A4]